MYDGSVLDVTTAKIYKTTNGIIFYHGFLCQ